LSLALGLSAFLLAATGAAAAPASRQSVEQLIQLMRLEKAQEGAFSMMEQMQEQMKRQIPDVGSPLPEAERRRLDERMERLDKKAKAVMREELGWEKNKEMYVRLYADTFSQEEIDAQVAFYGSPIGQAILDKQPVLMQKTGVLMQELAGRLMQKLNQIYADDKNEAAKAQATRR